MSRKEMVLGTVVCAIRAYLGNDSASLTGDTRLEEAFGIDSTEMVCIVVDLEKELGISLKGMKFSILQTPDDLVAAILDRMPT
ncbi:acyl carrier protein, partial [Azospirillum brasilense]